MILLFTTVVHLTPAATLVLPHLPLTTVQALGVVETHGQAVVLTVVVLQAIGKTLNLEIICGTILLLFEVASLLFDFYFIRYNIYNFH